MITSIAKRRPPAATGSADRQGRDRDRACPCNATQLRGIRRYLLGIIAVVLFAGLSAGLTKPHAVGAAEEGAVNDLLRMPAVRIANPAQGLLLDVTAAGSRLVAVGERGRIIYSDDGGVRWTQAEVPVCVTLTAVSFPTPQQGWAVGHDGVVLHTVDGGKRWARQLDGKQFNDRAYAQIEKLFKEAGGGDRKSGDGSRRPSAMEGLEIYLKDLKLLKEEGATWPFLDVWFANAQEGFAVGAFGMAARTSDGGKTWDPILNRFDNTEGLHYYAIAPVSRDLYVAGESGLLYRSEDRGLTWKRLQSPYDGSYFGIFGAHEGRAVIAFGLRGTAFRSIDRGQNWKPLDAPAGAAWLGGLQLHDGSLLMTSPALGAVRSRDGGISFSPVPDFPLGIVAAVASGGKDAGGIVAVGTFGAVQVPIK